MNEPVWAAVDSHFEQLFVGDDAALAEALRRHVDLLRQPVLLRPGGFRNCLASISPGDTGPSLARS